MRTHENMCACMCVKHNAQINTNMNEHACGGEHTCKCACSLCTCKCVCVSSVLVCVSVWLTPLVGPQE